MGGHVYRFTMITTTYHTRSKRETSDESSALFSTLLSANRHAYLWHAQSATESSVYQEINLKSPRDVDWDTPYSVSFGLSDTVSVSIEVTEVPIGGPNLLKGERDSSLSEWIAAERLGSAELTMSDDEGERSLVNHNDLNDVAHLSKRKRS